MTIINDEPVYTVTVERTEVLKTGAKNNRPWTLYQVHGHFGTPEEKGARLVAHKTFDAMPVGTTKVSMVPDREQHWMMLKLVERPQRAQPNGGGKSQLESDVRTLTARVLKLERQMAAIIANAEIPLP